MGWNLFLFCVLLVGSIEAASLGIEERHIQADLTSNAAFEYMKTLYEQPEDDMVSVKSYADADILAGNYQEMPQSHVDCTTLTHYRFSVGSLPNAENIQKVVLRAYLQVSPNAIAYGHSIEADLAITMRLHDAETNAMTEYEKVEAYQMTLTRQSSEWMKIDVTRGFISPQDLQLRVGENIQVELALSVHTDCQGENTKTPLAYFVDPASYHSSADRARHSSLQPFLIIYSREEHSLFDLLPEIEISDPPVTKLQRHSRSYSFGYDSCERLAYVINFQDLGLNSILLPREFDIGKCGGYCSTTGNYVHNTHDILSLLQRVRQDGSGDETISVPTGCLPTQYDPMYVLFANGDQSISLELVSEAIVSQCSCRSCSW